MSEINVDTIKDRAGNDAMSIDTSGKVTFSKSLTRTIIPSWRVGVGSSINYTSAGEHVVIWDTTTGEENFLDGGVTYGSGLITVPEAGLYTLGSSVRIDNATAGNYIRMRIYRNNIATGMSELYALIDDQTTTYGTVQISGVFKASASDNFRVAVGAQSDSDWHIQADSGCHFWGYKVG